MPGYIDRNGSYYEGDRQGSDAEVPQRPSPYHDWNGTAWVAGEAAKSAMWDAIKAERDSRTENGGYLVGAKWFHSDQKSRSQQLGLVLLGTGIPAGLQWKTMDGSFVPMTPTLAGQILVTAASSDQAIFAVAETHKAAMESCANPVSYDYRVGWPKGYGEA